MSDASVLILGASGLLGSTVGRTLRAAGLPVIESTGTPEISRVDFCDAPAALAYLDFHKPRVIINLIALANVDQCQRDPRAAYRLNAGVVETIARWLALNSGRHLIHISTDMVYESPGDSTEDDVSPLNAYALTKLCGDLIAESAGATVLRTNFFGPAFHGTRKTFSDSIIASLKAGSTVKLFNDVWFSPLTMQTLSSCLKRVIDRPVAGIFNLGSRDGLSKYDFGVTIARQLRLDETRILPSRLEDVNLTALRPNDMRMSSAKFETTYGLRLPSLTNEIQTLRIL